LGGWPPSRMGRAMRDNWRFLSLFVFSMLRVSKAVAIVKMTLNPSGVGMKTKGILCVNASETRALCS
jgi:hypothetical protein